MLALKREMNGFNADQRKLKPKESQILAEVSSKILVFSPLVFFCYTIWCNTKCIMLILIDFITCFPSIVADNL